MLMKAAALGDALCLRVLRALAANARGARRHIVDSCALAYFESCPAAARRSAAARDAFWTSLQVFRHRGAVSKRLQRSCTCFYRSRRAPINAHPFIGSRLCSPFAQKLAKLAVHEKKVDKIGAKKVWRKRAAVAFRVRNEQSIELSAKRESAFGFEIFEASACRPFVGQKCYTT